MAGQTQRTQTESKLETLIIFRNTGNGPKPVLRTPYEHGITDFDPKILPYIATLYENPKKFMPVPELRDANRERGHYSGMQCQIIEEALSRIVASGLIIKKKGRPNYWSLFRATSPDRLTQYLIQTNDKTPIPLADFFSRNYQKS